jgi:hypothetical protein
MSNQNRAVKSAPQIGTRILTIRDGWEVSEDTVVEAVIAPRAGLSWRVEIGSGERFFVAECTFDGFTVEFA